MKWWVVVADWPASECWECSGDRGHAWAVVAANTAEEAILLSKLEPQPYELAREVFAYELAATPTTNMKNKRQLSNAHDLLNLRQPRPSPDAVVVLRNEPIGLS